MLQSTASSETMNYTEQIHSYERELNINKGIIEQEYWHIGSNAWENPVIGKPLNDNVQYTEIIQHCDELQKQKNSLEGILADSERLREQLDDRVRSIENRKEEKQKLETDLQELFESAGTEVFDLYTKTPQQYIHYNASLPQLDELFRERYKLEGTISGDEQLPLVSQIVHRTKTWFLHARLKRLKRKTADMFREVGEQMSEEAESWNDEHLTQIFLPVVNQHAKIAELNRIIDRHQEGIQEIQAKRRDLSENQKPESHQKYLRLQISDLEEELRIELTKSGEILAVNLKSSPPEKLVGFFTSLEKLLKENKQKEKLIHRLRAAQQIESLREEQENIRQKKEEIRRQISALEQELRELDGSVEILDSEIASHEKIRGNEKDLTKSAQ